MNEYEQSDVGERNLIILSAFTFLSTFFYTIIQEVTKLQRCSAWSPFVEFAGSLLGFFVPLAMHHLGPKLLVTSLQYLDLFNLLKFLSPVKIITNTSGLISKWCRSTKHICELTILSLNSTNQTAVRNSAIYWIATKLSKIFCSIVLLSQLDRKTNPKNLTIIYYITVLYLLLSTTILKHLQPPLKPPGTPTALKIFSKSLKLLKTPNIWLYIYCFVYIGVQNVFNQEIYTLLDGQTQPEGLSTNQIWITLGAICGGFAITHLSKRYDGPESVLIGLVINLISYFYIYLNIPEDLILGRHCLFKLFLKDERNICFEVFCPFLLGFADACYHIQVLAILSTVYLKEISTVLAVYKFVLKASTTFSHAVYRSFSLLSLLIILSLLGAIGTLTCVISYKKPTNISSTIINPRSVLDFLLEKRSDDDQQKQHSTHQNPTEKPPKPSEIRRVSPNPSEQNSRNTQNSKQNQLETMRTLKEDLNPFEHPPRKTSLLKSAHPYGKTNKNVRSLQTPKQFSSWTPNNPRITAESTQSSQSDFITSHNLQESPSINPEPMSNINMYTSSVETPDNLVILKQNSKTFEESKPSVNSEPYLESPGSPRTLKSSPKSFESTKSPKSLNSFGYPKSLNSSGTPKSLNSSGSPKSLNSSGVPKSLNSSVSPKSLNSSVSPKSLNLSGIPKSLNSSGSPKRLESSRSPKSLNSSGSPKSMNSSGPPKNLKSSGSPKSLNSSGSPKCLNSSGSPKSLNSSGSPKNQSPPASYRSLKVPENSIETSPSFLPTQKSLKNSPVGSQNSTNSQDTQNTPKCDCPEGNTKDFGNDSKPSSGRRGLEESKDELDVTSYALEQSEISSEVSERVLDYLGINMTETSSSKKPEDTSELNNKSDTSRNDQKASDTIGNPISFGAKTKAYRSDLKTFRPVEDSEKKSVIPIGKLEIPNSKLEASNSKLEASNSNLEASNRDIKTHNSVEAPNSFDAPCNLKAPCSNLKTPCRVFRSPTRLTDSINKVRSLEIPQNHLDTPESNLGESATDSEVSKGHSVRFGRNLEVSETNEQFDNDPDAYKHQNTFQDPNTFKNQDVYKEQDALKRLGTVENVEGDGGKLHVRIKQEDLLEFEKLRLEDEKVTEDLRRKLMEEKKLKERMRADALRKQKMREKLNVDDRGDERLNEGDDRLKMKEGLNADDTRLGIKEDSDEDDIEFNAYKVGFDEVRMHELKKKKELESMIGELDEIRRSRVEEMRNDCEPTEVELGMCDGIGMDECVRVRKNRRKCNRKERIGGFMGIEYVSCDDDDSNDDLDESQESELKLFGCNTFSREISDSADSSTCVGFSDSNQIEDTQNLVRKQQVEPEEVSNNTSLEINKNEDQSVDKIKKNGSKRSNVLPCGSKQLLKTCSLGDKPLRLSLKKGCLEVKNGEARRCAGRIIIKCDENMRIECEELGESSGDERIKQLKDQHERKKKKRDETKKKKRKTDRCGEQKCDQNCEMGKTTRTCKPHEVINLESEISGCSSFDCSPRLGCDHPCDSDCASDRFDYEIERCKAEGYTPKTVWCHSKRTKCQTNCTKQNYERCHLPQIDCKIDKFGCYARKACNECSAGEEGRFVCKVSETSCNLERFPCPFRKSTQNQDIKPHQNLDIDPSSIPLRSLETTDDSCRTGHKCVCDHEVRDFLGNVVQTYRFYEERILENFEEVVNDTKTHLKNDPPTVPNTNTAKKVSLTKEQPIIKTIIQVTQSQISENQ